MPERILKIVDWLHYMPFIGLLVTQKSTIIDAKTSPMITRLIETAIMAVIAGGLAIYVSIPQMKDHIDRLKVGQDKIETKLDEKAVQIQAIDRQVIVLTTKVDVISDQLKGGHKK